MPACDICKQAPIEGDVLCGCCREAITRLHLICHTQPELRGHAVVVQSHDLETGVGAAA